MNFDQLKQFIMTDMQMSHIYQPVMIMELLKRNGTATLEQIAQAILNHDPTKIDYYSEIVKNMVNHIEKEFYFLKFAQATSKLLLKCDTWE